MSKTTGIIKVWLKYDIPEGQDPEDYLANVELPENYIEDSFEVVKIRKDLKA